MNATKSSRKMVSIDIPVTTKTDHRLIAEVNPSVQAALTRNKVIKMEGYAIPEKDGDLFRRQITILKKPKVRGVESIDMPDLEDVQLTDLPWMGSLTFKASSRQFRAKNDFTAVVQVVHRYGDFLWLLTDALSSSLNDGQLIPHLFNVAHPTNRNAYWSVSRHDPMSEESIAEAGSLPTVIVEKMISLGYHVVEDGFVYPGIAPKQPGHKINCHLYGRLQYVKDTSVCLVLQ